MLSDREAGFKEFEGLFAKYGEDGMLFLERAEAFEHLGLLDQAEADYLQAEAHLTSPHWKKVAALANRRICQTRSQKTRSKFVSSGNQQWDAFHRIHGLFRLPHAVRKRALPAIARIAAEPDSAAVDLRWCIEVVVGEVERRSETGHSREELQHRIEGLKQSRRVPGIVATQMHSVRVIGRQGAHPVGSSRPPDWVTGLGALVAVLEWAEGNVWR